MGKGNKGMSFEVKREKLNSIFTENKTFYHIDEVHKLGAKKGIPFQSIKDVLKSLLNDNLVESEKIGASVFYFSLPNKVFLSKTNKIKDNINEIERIKKENKSIQENIFNQKELKKETETYIDLKNKYEKLQIEVNELEKDIEKYNLNDPVKYNQYEMDNKIIQNSFEVISDNIFICNKIVKERGFQINEVLKEEDFCGLFEEEEKEKEEEIEEKEEKEEVEDEPFVEEENFIDENEYN